MPVGLEVINDDNILQIDGSFQNLCMVAGGEVVLSNASQNPFIIAKYARVAYPISSRRPVIAVNSPDYKVCFTVDDSGINFWGLSPSGPDITIEYYIFDLPEYSTSVADFGLEVWNEDGEEVFNSKNKYMKVLGFVNVQILKDSSYSGTTPAGLKIAVAMCVQSTGYLVENIGTTNNPAVAITMHQGQVQTPSTGGYTIFNAAITAFAGPGGGGAEGYNSPFNSALILDVTGY